MAKYEVDHSCGHTATHQLYGKSSERERKVEWFKNTLCSECYFSAKERERTEANAKAAQSNQSAGLPVLTGSEKQIAWAETIRAGVVSEVDTAIARYVSDKPADNTIQTGRDFRGWLAGKTESKWWIDNRELGRVGLYRMFLTTVRPDLLTLKQGE